MEFEIKYLIYTSHPIGFDEKNINNILEISKINNKKHNLTGCLVYRQDLYLQYLEGPDENLEITYKRILNDKRHSKIFKLSENFTTRRLFANWAMRGNPLMTSMWTNSDVKKGIIQEMSSDDAYKLFEKFSREIDQFN